MSSDWECISSYECFTELFHHICEHSPEGKEIGDQPLDMTHNKTPAHVESLYILILSNTCNFFSVMALKRCFCSEGVSALIDFIAAGNFIDWTITEQLHIQAMDGSPKGGGSIIHSTEPIQLQTSALHYETISLLMSPPSIPLFLASTGCRSMIPVYPEPREEF